MASPGTEFRRLWGEEALMLPGVFNALVARMAERLGFRAAYFSGGALSAGWAGLPDIGLVSVTEFCEQLAVITRATKLPLLCDADTGFGEVVNVERCVGLYERAGAAGLHIEDQILPKRCGHLSGKDLIAAHDMEAKVRAAASARTDPQFVIVARTDARSVEGFDAACQRAERYLAAGADMIFPEALESAEEFALFARRLPVPLVANMTEFGRGPLLTLSELAEMGYRAVIYPLTAFRSAMRAAHETLDELKRSGSQRARLETMQTRSELYDLLNYTDWVARDRAYFDALKPSSE